MRHLIAALLAALPRPGRCRAAEELRRARRGRDEGVGGPGRDHRDRRERQGHPRARLWHPEPRVARTRSTPTRCSRSVRRPRPSPPPRSRSWSTKARSSWDDRVIDHLPGLPHVRPLGHARDHGARPARPPQRPRPRPGRPDVRAVDRHQPRGPGAPHPLPEARDQLSLRLRLRQRALRGRRPGHRGRQRQDLGGLRRGPHPGARRHEDRRHQRRRPAVAGRIAPIRTGASASCAASANSSSSTRRRSRSARTSGPRAPSPPAPTTSRAGCSCSSRPASCRARSSACSPPRTPRRCGSPWCRCR